MRQFCIIGIERLKRIYGSCGLKIPVLVQKFSSTKGAQSKTRRDVYLLERDLITGGNLTGGKALREAIIADYAIDLILGVWFQLGLLSRAAQKTSVEVEKGKVYSEWQWVGFTVVINGVVYYFYFQ